MSSQMNCHIRSVAISILNAFCTMLAHSRSSIYCFISVVIVSNMKSKMFPHTGFERRGRIRQLRAAFIISSTCHFCSTPYSTFTVYMYVRAKLSEAKLSEHGATLRMRRTVRRTHEPNRDKRTERFGCFFMYRATPSREWCVSVSALKFSKLSTFFGHMTVCIEKAHHIHLNERYILYMTNCFLHVFFYMTV